MRRLGALAIVAVLAAVLGPLPGPALFEFERTRPAAVSAAGLAPRPRAGAALAQPRAPGDTGDAPIAPNPRLDAEIATMEVLDDAAIAQAEAELVTAQAEAELAEAEAGAAALAAEQPAAPLAVPVAGGRMLAGHGGAEMRRLADGAPFGVEARADGRWGIAIAYATLTASLAILLAKAIAAVGRWVRRAAST
ncbi:hypothetical protein [Acuticoccus sp. I52.16.1]|uniref:hypothetical protein n=1 Tax=Acuticoccus sp. I52.16.1 TaxID=2928472 RepID=UPI001FD27D0E|nr:hypothetical protein [Acuticoccus sp. I52.16.1]UOM33332.1 hypothetical protein MRB58_15870 [Acuticoccus sp. I52.16.1]